MDMNVKGMDMRTDYLTDRSFSAALPADLRTWVESSELIRWILEIQHADAGISAQPAIESSPRLQMLQTLLTYCYATGALATEEIERKIESDATIRYLCARLYPDGATLRQFRRYHRERIKITLSELLRRAWDEAKARSEIEMSVSIDPGVPWIGSWRSDAVLQEFRPNFEAEAEERIVEATHLDCMALDD